jgi:hypothetical protein
MNTKTLALAVILAAALCGQAPAQFTGPPGVLNVTSDPSGTCGIGSNLQFNTSNGKLWGCIGTWTQVGGSSSVAWGAITGTLSSQTDLQTALNAKLGTALTSTDIFVGNGSNVATAVAVSGDATLSNAGVLTFATVNSNTGSCGDATHVCQVTLNAKGLATAAVAVAITGSTPSFPVNPQTSTYTATTADFSACKVISAASGTFTVTLVASGSQPTNGQCIWVVNYGSGVVTIARSGQNINGGTSSLTLAAASATAPTAAFIVSDGTNYFASLMGVSSSGANPAGSYSEYQYRSNSTTFGAVTNSGPVPTSWTVVNCAAATRCAFDDFSARGVNISGSGGGLALGLATQSLGSPPYTVIAQLKITFGPYGTSGNTQYSGLYLYDGTKAYGIELGVDQSIQPSVWTRQCATLSSAGTKAGTAAYTTGGISTFKIVDDGTHRTWSYWKGGGTGWVQFLQETTATFLTPTSVGIGVNNASQTASITDVNLLYWCSAAATTCNGQ